MHDMQFRGRDRDANADQGVGRMMEGEEGEERVGLRNDVSFSIACMGICALRRWRWRGRDVEI